MPLKNHLKEYRAKKNINQQELGSMVDASRLAGGDDGNAEKQGY